MERVEVTPRGPEEYRDGEHPQPESLRRRMTDRFRNTLNMESRSERQRSPERDSESDERSNPARREKSQRPVLFSHESTSNGSPEKKAFISSPTARAAITIGAPPLALSYAAYLSNAAGTPAALASLGTAGAGAFIGRRLFPKSGPAGPALGAGIGAFAPPALKALGGVLQNVPAAGMAAKGVGGGLGAIGGIAAGRFLNKMFNPNNDVVRRRMINGVSIGAGSFAGYSFPGFAGAVGSALANIPTATVASLAPPVSLGIVAASSGIGLYWLGRWERWLADRKDAHGKVDTRVVPNIFGALRLPITLPVATIKKTGKVLKGIKRFLMGRL